MAARGAAAAGRGPHAVLQAGLRLPAAAFVLAPVGLTLGFAQLLYADGRDLGIALAVAAAVWAAAWAMKISGEGMSSTPRGR